MSAQDVFRTLTGLRTEALSLAKTIAFPRQESHPERRFVIFGRGRSGSTLLVSLLDSHPEITCLGELLNRPRLAPLTYVERELLRRPGSRRGFKLLSYQVRDIAGGRRTQRLREWIAQPDMTIIHIQRNDLLRHAVSNIYARERRAFHSTAKGAQRQKTIVVDFNHLMRWIVHSEELSRWETEFLGDLHRENVTYETDLTTQEQQRRTVDRLCGVLGLMRHEMKSDLSPVTPRSYDSFIANWDEIAERLADTPYARFSES
jgi:hypothetical protein